MRNQEVLERFFRVLGNNVEACWSGQGNMASGTQKRGALVLNERWNVPTSQSTTEKLKIHVPSTRTTVVRFNPMNEITMVVAVLTSPTRKVTVPLTTKNLFRHGEIGVTVHKTAPASIRTKTVWFCCNSGGNTTTKVRPGMFSEVTV